MYALFSLLIGITAALVPFLGWKLMLPVIIRVKASQNRAGRIVVMLMLLAKFIFLGLLIYGITRLSCLETPHFVIGLATGPVIIIGILLTLSLAKGR
jgi:hypothetical protein